MESSSTGQLHERSVRVIIVFILTVSREVEQVGQITKLASSVSRIGELGGWVSQLVEEGVNHGINGGLSLSGGVLEQAGNKVDGVGICLAEDLVEGVRLDLRELMFHVVGVHRTDLFPSRCSQHLDNLHKLVNA